MWTVRTAAEEDAAALHEIAEVTFRDAFAPFNTPSDMDLHCSRAFTLEMQAEELRDPDIQTLVVDDGETGRFQAYAQLRMGEPPACVRAGAPIELQRFYVRSGLHGQGLAQQLMAAVLDRAGERGADTIWLGVWERNSRAIRFYAKCGFRETGDHMFLLGSDPQRDLILVRLVRGEPEGRVAPDPER